jgi:hypothetical protein
MMVRSRTILAVVLVAAGLVWIGQGTNLLQGSSFMVGDGRWAVIGGATLIAGLVVGLRELSRRGA